VLGNHSEVAITARADPAVDTDVVFAAGGNMVGKLLRDRDPYHLKHDFRLRPGVATTPGLQIRPHPFPLGATGFASAEMAAAHNRFVVPRSRCAI
jgi:hypothetical protein